MYGPVDLQKLCHLIQGVSSIEQHVRAPAENELKQMKAQPGFAVALLMVLANQQLDGAVKLQAAVFLKNLAKYNWAANADEIVPAEDKATVRREILNLVLSSTSTLRGMLLTTSSLIASADFPKEWPALVGELVQRAHAAFSEKKLSALLPVLDLMHGVFSRYRDAYELTEAIKEEILPIISAVGPCLLAVSTYTSGELKKTADQAAAKQLLEIVKVAVELYHDLTCLDLAPFFEDNLKGFMCSFLEVMQYSNPGLTALVDEEAGPVEVAKTAVVEMLTLFLNKYDEDFKDFLPAYTQNVWETLTKLTLEAKFDELAMASMEFLSATARSIHHPVFEGPGMLSTVCEQVVIPSIRIRDSDVEAFMDPAECEEYIQKDIEGSDMHTRRRAACDLVHALCKNYEKPVTEIFQVHVATLLQAYAGQNDWKAKDCAIYLITALCIRQSASNVAKDGVSTTNSAVNIGEFFQLHILPELQTHNNDVKAPKFPVLTADVIRFLSSFRVQIPPENFPPCIQLMTEWLNCPNEVIVTYSAAAIERILLMRSKQGVQYVPKEAIMPMAGPLFNNLFAALQRASRENHYLMMCLMRVIRTAEDLVGPHIRNVLAPLAAFLSNVTNRPSNPSYNHYLFESISALVKYNPAQVSAIEEALFSNFAVILQRDVAEFMPYVFQIYAQLLEKRPDVPQSYCQLLPLLVAPQLYENKGNIPAVIRFLTVFVEKIPQKVADDDMLTPMLSVYQKLLSSKTLDHEAFVLLDSIIQSIPYDRVKPHMGTIIQLMCVRLTQMKTAKFCKMVVLFCSMFVHRQGPEELVAVCESIQPNLFNMLFGMWLTYVMMVEGRLSRKASAVGLIHIVTESPTVQSNPETWARAVKCLVSLINGEKEKDAEGHLYDNAVHEVDKLGTKYSEGYTNAYCPLACAAKEEVDYTADVSDASAKFFADWTRMMQQPGSAEKIEVLRRTLPEPHKAFLKL